jgi:hypothetical protein
MMAIIIIIIIVVITTPLVQIEVAASNHCRKFRGTWQHTRDSF